jgi:hypothetical protein
MAFNTGTKILWALGGVMFGLGLLVWLWAREQVDSLNFANELSIGLGLGGSDDYLNAVGLAAASSVVMDFGAFVLLVALAVSAIGEFVLRAGRADKQAEVQNSEA